MELNIEYWEWQPKETQCLWRIGTADMRACTFPSDERLKELGLQILSTTREGHHPRFLGINRGSNHLILNVLPGTKKHKLEKLTGAIGLESSR